MAGPITLTKPQFLATAAGAKPGSSYQNYLAYIAKARASNPAAAPADPYSSIIGSLPKPQTGQQIQQQAAGEISPLVAAATKQITDQVNAQTGAISGFSNDAAAKLAAMDFTAPYTQGETSQAAVDEALRQQLAGAGSSDSASLASRLAALGSNDPTVAAAAANVASNGAASGTTELAHGSAALGNLIANAASAGSYGQKLPGIQRAQGLQEISAAQQAGQNNIASQTQTLESQLPQIIQSLTGENDSRASAISAARQNQVARQDAINATSANNATKLAQTKASAAAGITKAQIAAQTKATQVSRPNASLSSKVGYLVDSNGNWIPGADGKPQVLPGFKVGANGQVVKAGKPASGASVSQVQSFLKTIPTYQTVSKNDGSGTTTSTKQQNGQSLTYTAAYKRLRQMGQTDQAARNDLSGMYKRGENGRAWLTNEEQAVLRQAQAKTAGPGVNLTGVKKATVNGQSAAFLTPSQAQWLKAAGQLPAGEWNTLPNSTTQVYYIKP